MQIFVEYGKNILDKKYLGNVVGLSVSVTAGHLTLDGVKGCSEKYILTLNFLNIERQILSKLSFGHLEFSGDWSYQDEVI